MIELKSVTQTFRKDFYSQKFNALDSVSFKVITGNITGFLGANGAGKTTSLKVILKFIRQSSGDVFYGDDGLLSFDSFIKRLGYLPERPYFHASLTGREFVRYMGELHGMHSHDIEKQMKLLSVRIGIDHALDRKLLNYSKGMLQRIGFVACLVHNPDYLILDEPVSGLDPVGRKLFKDVLIQLHREGKTIFFSSHIVSDIEEICQELVVLNHGKVIYNGSLLEILEKESTRQFEVILSGDHRNLIQGRLESEMIGHNLTRLKLDLRDKEGLLSLCVSKKIEVLSLNDLSPTLEQIIYNNAGDRA